MTLKDMLLCSGGVLVVAMTFIQISPIKIDPWGALFRFIGRSLNKDILHALEKIDYRQRDTHRQLEEHIRVDNERDADTHRQRILRFNADLIKGENFTHEYFMDILIEIDEYERYCAEHPEYRNNRAVLAIKNIKRVCEEKERDNSFALG